MTSYEPRTYGRIRGRRLKKRLRRFWELRAPALLLEPSEMSSGDVTALFANPDDRVVLDVGIGDGEHFIGRCRDPENRSTNFIGCDPYVNGVARTLEKVVEGGLGDRVRLASVDVRALTAKLDDECLDRISVLFPDPWPKRRHHKRRLPKRRFLLECLRLLKGGGELEIASDHAGLLSEVLAGARTIPDFDWITDRPELWYRDHDTRYAKKARERGIKPVTLVFKKRRKDR